MASIVDIKERQGFMKGDRLIEKISKLSMVVISISPIRDDFLVCVDRFNRCHHLRPNEVEAKRGRSETGKR